MLPLWALAREQTYSNLYIVSCPAIQPGPLFSQLFFLPLSRWLVKAPGEVRPKVHARAHVYTCYPSFASTLVRIFSSDLESPVSRISDYIPTNHTPQLQTPGSSRSCARAIEVLRTGDRLRSLLPSPEKKVMSVVYCIRTYREMDIDLMLVDSAVSIERMLHQAV